MSKAKKKDVYDQVCSVAEAAASKMNRIVKLDDGDHVTIEWVISHKGEETRGTSISMVFPPEVAKQINALGGPENVLRRAARKGSRKGKKA